MENEGQTGIILHLYCRACFILGILFKIFLPSVDSWDIEFKQYFPILHSGCIFFTFLWELKVSELEFWKAFLWPVIPVTFCGFLRYPE